jgi:hypothetical protein
MPVAVPRLAVGAADATAGCEATKGWAWLLIPAAVMSDAHHIGCAQVCHLAPSVSVKDSKHGRLCVEVQLKRVRVLLLVTRTVTARTVTTACPRRQRQATRPQQNQTIKPAALGCGAGSLGPLTVAGKGKEALRVTHHAGSVPLSAGHAVGHDLVATLTRVLRA